MPRYVILEHTGSDSYKPGCHWDLMLEWDGRLKTWELAAIPSSGAPSACRILPDHRLAYLEYEGPLTQNRGEVRRWDAGEYAILSDFPGLLTIRLSGKRLVGTLRISLNASEARVGTAFLDV